ncbi:MAG: eukaryotic-like serine/threonine-protein kinase [Thermoleophilaceae bacterium]|jgi:serine/threonine-protein kinase|nr:eukaryotic-like serine/threonine-protein kinase [Thermoleophilaceae bacterium]
MTVIGTLIGDRFRLEEKVGSGGMSSVYRAFDPTLERRVAIKLMHRDISSDPDQLERFRREARAVAQLNHPHVVTVIDAGEDDGAPFIVFEFVEGETLKDRIRRLGRLPVAEAVAYAVEIGRALECAHVHRLVHRDVKPQNVLIDADGRAKVTDFGIARSLEAHGLTATGRVLGTTDYVSPEQALGHEVTAQSDIYSLGIVLYEMLTGEAPFKADTQVAVAMKHVREPLPDVQKRRPEISAALAAVVERATAKETQNRYATVEEMVHDLEEVLAIEAARSGQATGEATTVLRSLSDDTADFAPQRLRHPRRTLFLSIAALAIVAGTVAFFATRTEKGPGAAATPRTPGLSAVMLSKDAASDYDPEGDGQESPGQVRFAIDGNQTTVWDTERYEGGFEGSNKSGVGLYVDAGQRVAARQLDLLTSTPGFRAAVYASDSVPGSISDWEKVSATVTATREQAIQLDTARQGFRNYLLWISELPEGGQVTIKELSLKK